MKTSFRTMWKAMILICGIILVSCSDSDDPTPEEEEEEVVIDIDKKVSVQGSVTSIEQTSGRIEAVSITTFFINISDVEFVIDETDDRSASEESYSADDFSGPFLLDLLSTDGTIDLAGADLPLGTYDEIMFNISPSSDAASVLDGKSVLIEGTIDGTPFTYWTDATDAFEVNFSKNGGDLTISETGYVAKINFDLNAMFGTNDVLDLSTATDGNGDGTIDIYSGDQDGNSVLAVKILSELENNTKINEEEDLDEDGIGNSEDDDIDGDGIPNEEDDDDDNDGTVDSEDDDADGDGTNDDEEDDGTGQTDDDTEEEDEAADITALLSSEAWIISEYTINDVDQLANYMNDFNVTFGDDPVGDTIRIEINGQWEDGDWELITNIDPPAIIFEFDYNGFFPGMIGVWDITSISETELVLEGDILLEGLVFPKRCVMTKP